MEDQIMNTVEEVVENNEEAMTEVCNVGKKFGPKAAIAAGVVTAVIGGAIFGWKKLKDRKAKKNQDTAEGEKATDEVLEGEVTG